jgi:hypothetical protein
MSSKLQGRAYLRLSAPIDASSAPTIGIDATRLLDPIGSFGQTEHKHREELHSLIQNHLHTLTNQSADQDRTLVEVAKLLVGMTAATTSVRTGTCPDDAEETVDWELAGIDLSMGGETYATVHRVPESPSTPSTLQTTYKPLSEDPPASDPQIPVFTHTDTQPASQTSVPINVALHIGVIKPGVNDGVVQNKFRIRSETYTVEGTDGNDDARLRVLHSCLADSIHEANGSGAEDSAITYDTARDMCFAAGKRAIQKAYGDLLGPEGGEVVVSGVFDKVSEWKDHKKHVLGVYQEAWGPAAPGKTSSPPISQSDRAGGGSEAELRSDKPVRSSGCSRLTKVAGIAAVTGAIASALYYSLRDTLNDE